MHVREARLVVAAFVLQNHGVGGAVRRPAVGTRAVATEETSEERRRGGEWCSGGELVRPDRIEERLVLVSALARAD